MNAKEYLKRLVYIDADINARIAELAQVRANLQVAKSSAPKPISVQEGHEGVYDDRYLKLFELDEAINCEIRKLTDLKVSTRGRIDRCKNPLHSVILREKYINRKSWEELEDIFGYTRRQLHRIHGDALQDFTDQNKDVTKCH